MVMSRVHVKQHTGQLLTAPIDPNRLTYVDLFCGIGGFHVAGTTHGMQCVGACDIDEQARMAYQHNFHIVPEGDITKVEAHTIPDHDMLFAGFPCQPFSIIGKRKGFEDLRGTLFFEILRIAQHKRPPAIVLENVRQLVTHDNGKIMNTIINALESIGYWTTHKILNALDFGLPQKRERVIIVAIQGGAFGFEYPQSKVPMRPLSEVLESKPPHNYFVSERIRQKRHAAHSSKYKPAIWHENKGGNVNSYPYSCALRAGASHNYLLVDGERRLTPREMLRLQGFPESFEIVCTESQTRKQAGNAVPVPMVSAVVGKVKDAVRERQKTEVKRQNAVA